MTASERLRRKLDLVGPAATLPARALLEHPNPAEAYPRYLAVGYHVTWGMMAVMEAALERSRTLAPADTVASGLAGYLDRHIREETHHDEPGGAVLDDLRSLDVEVEALLEAPSSTDLARLIGAQYYWILHRHPVAVLGFLELEAYHSELPVIEGLIERTGLPREAFRQLILHARLDAVHARELHELLDSLPLEPRHEQLVGLSAVHTIGVAAKMLLDAVRAELPAPA
jgi:Iron-containing redox enzyme